MRAQSAVPSKHAEHMHQEQMRTLIIPGQALMLLVVFWIRIHMDPDSRRAKMTHKREEISSFEAINALFLGVEDFSCSCDVLYGGLGIIAIFDPKNIKVFFSRNFGQFLVIKTLDPDPHWPKMLDPDPHRNHRNQCRSKTLIFRVGPRSASASKRC
jgi:hypothetical protein